MHFYIKFLIFINILVFGLQILFTNGGVDQIALAFARENFAINKGQIYRLLTSAFLHADFFHLFFNMYSLYSFGGVVLEIFKEKSFLTIYFLSAIFASLGSYFLVYFTKDYTISVGASGAIFGLVGAILAYSIHEKNNYFIRQIGIVVAINLAIGFMPNSHIDNAAHIFGLICGCFLGFFLPKNSHSYI